MERTARNRHELEMRSRPDGPVGTHSRLCWPRRADRASLLTGTALVSTLLLTCLLGPNPAQAASCSQPPSPAPISDLNVNATIICVNTEPRTSAAGNAIELSTIGNNHDIDLYNSGLLTAYDYGIFTSTTGKNSVITIENAGDVAAGYIGISAITSGKSSNIIITNGGGIIAGDSSVPYAFGIYSRTSGSNADTTITNSGDIYAGLVGIIALADGTQSDITITNSGDIVAPDIFRAAGIVADTYADNGDIIITNSGDIAAGTSELTFGIIGFTAGSGSDIEINNSGSLTALTGILGITDGDNSNVVIRNSGDIAGFDGIGVYAFGSNDSITVVNSGAISTENYGIRAVTYGESSPIDIDNSGGITAGDDALTAATNGNDAAITIINSGTLDAGDFGPDYSAGINAITSGDHSGITIDNSGDSSGVYGLLAVAFGTDSDITITNGGGINAVYGGIRAFNFGGDFSEVTLANSGAIDSVYVGVSGHTEGDFSDIAIANSGGITVTSTAMDGFWFAIGSFTSGNDSDIGIINGGNINSAARGIAPLTLGGDSEIAITNSGDITAGYTGIDARTYGNNSNIQITNSGDVTAGDDAIRAETSGNGSAINIINSGMLVAGAYGPDYSAAIYAVTSGASSPISVSNSGDLAGVYGVRTFTHGPDSDTAVTSSGDINAIYGGIRTFSYGASSQTSIYSSSDVNSVYVGVSAASYDTSSNVTIINSGDITTTYGALFFAIGARTNGDFSDVLIVNSGNIDAAAAGISSLTTGDGNDINIVNNGDVSAGLGALRGRAIGTGSVSITNSGHVMGGSVGVYAFSNTGTSIVNSGSIVAGSALAIDIAGAASTVTNENGGVITGFVDLTANADLFDNENGGTFEARLASDFGGGLDIFNNAGTVHVSGGTSFDNLEEFNTQGVISLADGQPDDMFTIGSSTAFHASGNSTLAVDTNFGAEASDLLVIDGNVSGKTVVLVSNSGPGADVFNNTGIAVVEVNGATAANAFDLKKPIDTGFFTWDLYFEPGATNVFELRSEPGNNALALPKLTTAVQGQWHTASDTWFDRTAELRLALARAPRTDGTAAVPGYQAITPGLWLRGPAAGLSPDGIAFTSSGEASLGQGQLLGFDFAAPNLVAPGDTFIFGALGGIVTSDLDDDGLASSFDLDGGQVGAYMAYLNRGLFINTLIKADSLEVDPNDAPGFAGSLDASNLGVRVDAGYRFGGFGPGMYFEPLATMSVVDSQIDDFTEGGNRIEFDDGTSLQGRLGLRVGTSFAAGGMTVEPFVTGGLWHEFADENEAVLTSSGTKFKLTDDVAVTWAEIGAGVNLIDLGAGISGFGKIDVAFSDEIDDASGHAGVRYEW